MARIVPGGVGYNWQGISAVSAGCRRPLAEGGCASSAWPAAAPTTQEFLHQWKCNSAPSKMAEVVSGSARRRRRGKRRVRRRGRSREERRPGRMAVLVSALGGAQDGRVDLRLLPPLLLSLPSGVLQSLGWECPLLTMPCPQPCPGSCGPCVPLPGRLLPGQFRPPRSLLHW